MINQFFDQNEIVNVNDYEAYAKNILDPAIWAYFSGAAGDELSQHRNLKAWRDINLQPRALTNLCALSTETTILDRKISHPIFIAPFAFQKLLHPQGETACAYASAVLEAGFVLSDQSSRDPVAVANIYLSEENRGLLWCWRRSNIDHLCRSKVDQGLLLT